jgi:carbonic anhydrase
MSLAVPRDVQRFAALDLLSTLAVVVDQQGAVVDDVRRIRNHPLVPAGIPVYGYVYDVRSGRLIEVDEATAVGAAR